MAFAPEEYSLIDFGEGRRLERFGPLVLDRPCPAADQAPRSATAARWAAADARFGGRSPNGGAWSERPGLPERWTVRHGAIRFELKRTGFGHLGIFPEQAVNWDWIAGQLRATGSVLRVLNLFAYTGGCTMAAARAGAEVVHVDAAQAVGRVPIAFDDLTVGMDLPARVESSNNFPAGAGIASSASAFAALALAASKAAGLELSEPELSALARRGSGSACRSIPDGFVEWLPSDISLEFRTE